VHITHNYGCQLGRRMHPLGRWLTPAVGRRMQRSWLDFATAGWSGEQAWSGRWPRYDTRRRATLVIRSASDVIVDDPDAARRSAWEGLH
jgi:para-nitrobenzyl esterase